MQRLFLFEPVNDRLDHDARNAHDQNYQQKSREFFHVLILRPPAVRPHWSAGSGSQPAEHWIQPSAS